jgi:hypothetical protein
MKARRILVPIDFSTDSDTALEMATSLARDCGGSLIIAHVEIIPLSAARREYLYALPEPPTEELLAKLVAVVLPDSYVTVERRLLAGDPADAIIRLAETRRRATPWKIHRASNPRAVGKRPSSRRRTPRPSFVKTSAARGSPWNRGLFLLLARTQRAGCDWSASDHRRIPRSQSHCAFSTD